MITVCMSTFPTREDVVLKAIRSLVAQELRPDAFILYLNEYQEIPEWTPANVYPILGIEHRGDIKDLGKFYAASVASPQTRVLVFADDDIEYPPDYLKAISRCALGNVGRMVGYHGFKANPEEPSYFRGRHHRYHFAERLKNPLRVDILGTGVSAVAPHGLRFSVPTNQLFARFGYEGAGDIELAILLENAGHERIVLPHEKDWIKQLDAPGESLYAQHYKNPAHIDALFKIYLDTRGATITI